MLHRLAGLALAAAALLAAAAPASAVPVTVRVEGASTTLVPTTTVDTAPGTFVVNGGGPCSGTSFGGALQRATGGDWGGRVDAQGQRVETIRGETYLLGADFTGVFWSLYVNDKPLQTGACNTELQTGDEALAYAACGGATAGCFAGEPLDLRAPAVVAPGTPFTATVSEVTTTFDPNPPFTATTVKAPSAGATISVGAERFTTDAAGRATIALTQRGPVTLTATKGDRVRESVSVCVSNGSDGLCGSTVPGAPAAATPTATVDRTAPRARLLSPRNGRTYRVRRFSPRLIRVAVDETGSGVRTVKLRLTRRVGNRCFSFSGRRERFIGVRCGRGFFFTVSDRADVSFLLPERLRVGRYVLDAEAIDRAFNRDTVGERGRNRSVFEVR
jgi:hypothetical protein